MTISNWKIPTPLYGIIFAVVVGAIGIYVNYKMTNYRVDKIEPKVEQHENRITIMETKMTYIVEGIDKINTKLDRQARSPR